MSITDRNKALSYIILGVGGLIVIGAFAYFGSVIDLEASGLAFDWQLIWNGLGRGHFEWSNVVNVPPWGMLLLLPLGLLPLEVGWGVIVLVILAALLANIPRMRNRILYTATILLAMLNFITLRNIADANLEPFVLAAIMLLVYSYEQERPYLLAFGVLAATLKPHLVFMLLLVLAFYLIRERSPDFILKSGGVTAAVVLVTMLWKGGEWLNSLTSKLDPNRSGISLSGLHRLLGLPVGVIIVLQLVVAGVCFYLAYRGNRTLNRLKVAMLVGGAMLVSPYTNNLSLWVILILGIIPIWIERRWLGGFLFALYFLPFAFLLNQEFYAAWFQHYWMLVLIITWLGLVYMVYRGEVKPSSLPAG